MSGHGHGGRNNTALYAGAVVVVIGAGYYLYKKYKQKR